MKKLILTAIAFLAYGIVSAQDSNAIITKFNDALAALTAKNYAAALPLFEGVIENGIDSEDSNVLNCVANAKKYVPVCYQRIGLAAAGQKNFEEAIKNLSASAEKYELYGDMAGKAKSNAVLAKVYQVQGGEAFNNKDYAAAAAVFSKGYAANPRNTDMALNLAMSYCESGEYQKGMDVYTAISNMKPAEKYAEPIAKAKEMMAMYTNNEVAKLQQANDFDGIITMSETMLASDPASAIAQKIRLQAYSSKKDYAKVIELAEAAAAAQTDEAEKSTVYFILGAACNAKELKPQAIAAFQKVTAGSNLDAAKAALAELKK